MIIGTILLAGVVIAWFYILWTRRRLYMCAWKMKGPWGYPFIGIVHQIYKMEDFLYVLPDYAKKYNRKSYFTWLGPFPLIYTIDPKVADIILQSPDCLNKNQAYKAIDIAAGSGLLTSTNPKWSQHRKLLSPCFTYKVLLGLIPTFNNFARELCGKIDKLVGQGESDVKELALKMGLKAAFAITMGVNVEESPNSNKIIDSFETLLELVVIRTLQPWLTYDAVYRLTSTYKTFSDSQEVIEGFIRELVKKKIKILETEAANGKVEQESEKSTLVFIDQAIKMLMLKEFTMQEIIHECNIMVIAAYETTANTLFTTLLFWAMNPDIQERVFDEVSTLFAEKEFDVTYDHFKNLVYLEMCINETLRLTPSIPMIGRRCDKDVRISEDITIPAGGEIYIDIFNIHRDPDIWGPTALTYNPDHFLPSNLEGKHKCAYMPFSKGKRNCLGWQYAGMFLRVMLAQIIRKYKFTTTFRFEDLRCMQYMSLRYLTTPKLVVHRR